MLLTLHCVRSPSVSPDSLYRSIEQRFIAGQLAEADYEFRRTYAVIETSGPEWAARFRLLQSRIWVYQGRYREALALLELPLPHDSTDPVLAISRGTLLSIALRRTGDVASATRALSDTAKLCPNEPSCAEIEQAQGIVAVENDRLVDARRAFELSLAGARNSGDRFLQMQVLLNLGVVALRQEHYDDALDRFADASVLANAIGARLALEKATGNVGWTLYKLGDYRHALANSLLAGKQAYALGSPIDQVGWINDAGLSQYRLGDLNAARSSYEQSLQLARSIHNSEEISDALVALASLSFQMGDLEDALERSREAEQIAEQRGNNSDTLRPALIEALVLAKQGQAAAARDRLISLQQRSSGRLSIRWEIENALARLSAGTGDKTSADTWFRRAISTFHSQRSSVTKINSRLPFIENGSTLYLSYMEFLIHEGRMEDALGILDNGRAETLAEGISETPGSVTGGADASIRNPSAVAQRLNATILVYCLRSGTSYLWAVSPKHVGFFHLPGSEVILPLIDSQTRAVMSSKDVLSQEDAAGSTLYRYLVGPASNVIVPGGRVFVIADEGMHSLNFETLLAPGDKRHFWIEDVNVINARSLSLLAKNQPKLKSAEGPKRLLLIGDPVYSRPEYEQLPHAHEEVVTVAEHFASTQRIVRIGPDATAAAYHLSRPEDFAYIHFVAHSVANDINPLDSAVILSTTAGGPESYKLYARDILDQKLQADLVTISSCYGSGVRSYAGEGLVGLTWAFLHAGSHNVIGALWEVSDISTPRLMNDLYDGLARGDSPSAALRSAKLAMIHSGGIFRKPFYWAPFQLYAGA